MDKLSERLSDVLYETIGALSQVEEDIIKAGLERLSAYEETGLLPEQVVKMGVMFEDSKRYSGRLEGKLRAYEEIGLKPGEISRILDAYGRGQTLRTESAERLGIVREIETGRLRELACADRDGRLVVLPATKVFAVEWDVGPTCDLICPVTIDGRGQCHFCDHGKPVVTERACTQADIPYIGKTVFFTYEEAEAARVSEVGAEEGGKRHE